MNTQSLEPPQNFYFIIELQIMYFWWWNLQNVFICYRAFCFSRIQGQIYMGRIQPKTLCALLEE